MDQLREKSHNQIEINVDKNHGTSTWPHLYIYEKHKKGEAK